MTVSEGYKETGERNIPEKIYENFRNDSGEVDLSLIITAKSLSQSLISRINEYDKIVVRKEILLILDQSQKDKDDFSTEMNSVKSNISIFLRTKGNDASLNYIVACSRGKFIAFLSSQELPYSEDINTMVSEIGERNVKIVTAGYKSIQKISVFHTTVQSIIKKIAHFLLPQSAEMKDPFSPTMLVKADILERYSISDDRHFSPLKVIVDHNYGRNEHHSLEFESKNRKVIKSNFAEFIGYSITMLKLAHYRPLRFLIVGLIGVIVNEGLLAFLHAYVPILAIISPIAIEASILSNYFLNALWTFRERNKSSNRSTFSMIELIKYNLVALGGLAVNLVFLLVLTHYGMEYLEANVVGIIFGFILNYLGSEKIVWKHTENANA